MFQVLLGGVVGVASGMRHAMEPDHLAAVSTLVSGRGAGQGRAAVRFATAWGLGHAAMLLVVSGALVITRHEMPTRVGDGLEAIVGAMLVALGVRAIVARKSPRGHDATHTHGARDLARPLLVGLVHGLAGSGAVTALTLATIGTPLAGLGYIALYGFGATVGMAMLAGVAGAPLARIAKSDRAMRALSGLTGATSLLIGMGWGLKALGRLIG